MSCVNGCFTDDAGRVYRHCDKHQLGIRKCEACEVWTDNHRDHKCSKGFHTKATKNQDGTPKEIEIKMECAICPPRKTREEAEAIIAEVVRFCVFHYEEDADYSFKTMIKDIKTRILDALYPKPESERLKRLKELRGYQRVLAIDDMHELWIEVLDEAIAWEEAKS